MKESEIKDKKVVREVNKGFEYMTQLESQTLEEIDLSFNKIRDMSIMAGWNCPNLKKIFLRFCGADKIGSLNLPSLESINLS